MPVSALAGLSLLIIGDSHMATPTYLIKYLPDELVSQGAEVHAIGVCGSHPKDWLSVTPSDCDKSVRVNDGKVDWTQEGGTTEPIKQLISKDKPNAVVVVMGDTMSAYNNPVFPKAWAYGQVTALTSAIKSTGTACYWVGPGWDDKHGMGRYHKNNDRVKVVDEFLSKNVAPCTYISTIKMTTPGKWKTLDGQHYFNSGYKIWATDIVKFIDAHPPKK